LTNNNSIIIFVITNVHLTLRAYELQKSKSQKYVVKVYLSFSGVKFMTKSRENFVRLAEGRTNKILKDLDLLSNLSNTTNYTYAEADVRKIFDVLGKKLKDTERRFDVAVKKNSSAQFKL